MVISMPRQWLFVPAVVLAVTAVSPRALAQDPLETIVTKRKIDNRDRATIETEVALRAKRLIDAGTDDDRRASARERLTTTCHTKGATTAGLDAYAGACADELASLTTSEAFEAGFDAISVLVELDNANAAPALAVALKSPHAAIRYRAARGLQRLHKKLAKSREACREILRALGDAGAAEQQEVVLKMIYEAIDFGADMQDPDLADGCARALDAVFGRRLAELKAGRRNETTDLRGYQAAAGSYAAAGAAQKTRLIGHMAGFLTHAVARYFAEDTAEDYLPTLAELISEAENVIHAMIKASKKREPSKRIGDVTKGRRPTPKMEQAAQAALADLKAVLKGDPWNLP